MAPLAASAEQADARNESRTAAPAFDDVPPPPAPAAAAAFVPPTRAAREAVIEIERSRAVATALGRGSGRVDARKHAARRRRDERIEAEKFARWQREHNSAARPAGLAEHDAQQRHAASIARHKGAATHARFTGARPGETLGALMLRAGGGEAGRTKRRLELDPKDPWPLPDQLDRPASK